MLRKGMLWYSSSLLSPKPGQREVAALRKVRPSKPFQVFWILMLKKLDGPFFDRKSPPPFIACLVWWHLSSSIRPWPILSLRLWCWRDLLWALLTCSLLELDAVGRELPYLLDHGDGGDGDGPGIRMGTARSLESNCGFLFPWRRIQAFGPAARFLQIYTTVFREVVSTPEPQSSVHWGKRKSEELSLI